jgi:hypothetical protein
VLFPAIQDPCVTLPDLPDTLQDSDIPKDRSGQPRSHGLVAVLSKDLFFGMRIRTSLRQLGYAVAIAQDARTFAIHLAKGDQRASLGIVDFNFPVDWGEIREAMTYDVPIIAFGPHMDVEGFKAAKQAGVTRVIANGEFSRSLPDLAKRYARQD